MYFLSKMGIFHCYVSLPEGTLKLVFEFQLTLRRVVFVLDLGCISLLLLVLLVLNPDESVYKR